MEQKYKYMFQYEQGCEYEWVCVSVYVNEWVEKWIGMSVSLCMRKNVNMSMAISVEMSLIVSLSESLIMNIKADTHMRINWFVNSSSGITIS